MKNWLWIPLAAVVGLVVGSWGPREDVKALAARLQDAQSGGQVSGAAGFGAFARLTGIPDVAGRRTRSAGKEPARPKPPDGTVATNAVPQPGKPPRLSGRERMRRHLTQEDLRVRIDEAAELWLTRVELATVRWKDRLGVSSGGKSEAFDSAVADMNESLRDLMQELAEEIEATGRMTPELTLRTIGDASRVLAETYDALGAAVPDENRGELSELPVFDFVDPAVAEPLIGVQDKIEGGLGERPR